MDALTMQGLLQAALWQQVEGAARSAALLSPPVAAGVAGLVRDLSATVQVVAGRDGLDFYVRAPSDTHPDAMRIALERNVGVPECLRCWVNEGVTGRSHMCQVRLGRLSYICDSAITVAEAG